MVYNRSKKWLFIDIVLITLILILVVCNGIYIHHYLFEPIFIFLLGTLFLTSKTLHSKLYISCIFYWIADNVCKPRTRINHILSGILCIFVGFLTVTIHAEKNKIDLYRELGKSLEFWIAIAIVVIFNILVGIHSYTSKKRKLDENKKDM